MNSVSLVGRVLHNPELEKTENNTAFAYFYLATKDDDSTSWVKIVGWGKSAKLIGKYVKKGSLIGINGHLYTRQCKRSGVKYTSCEVIADEIELCDSKE